ncbi:L,D-transpeptidase family protein [Halocella sp. SP3-1]|uniref:L,D-transpeptidase family protein n=1 Tax=Halocella sp. SP3-1 TaxID=2382161 RepID=UPI000F762C3F|nr:L,D-transpeptidase family protein [Halocella sp. SP3-1]AZO95325.1 hypothetical protein D7D81_12365 [Halocella sp. SP3-1]
MKKIVFLMLIFFIIVNVFLLNYIVKAELLSDRIIQRMGIHGNNHIEAFKRIDKINSDLLKGFYKLRNYQPAWCKETRIYQITYDLLTIIKNSYQNGLNPDDYAYTYLYYLIKGLEADINNDKVELDRLLKLELLLTEIYFKFSNDLLYGVSKHKGYDLGYQEIDLPVLLNNALETDNLRETIKNLDPIQPLYARMQLALKRLLKIFNDGGWPLISDKIELKKGVCHQAVLDLRERLLLSGDLKPENNHAGLLFDDKLAEAVALFQLRHGLPASEILDEKTLTALNTSVEERIRQLKINMDRLRWLPQKREDIYIVINIPDFKLEVMKDYSSIFESRVIVGDKNNQSPLFRDEIEYIVINPYWKITDNIAKYEILPKLKNDPAYLDRNKIKILESWHNDSKIVLPESIEWHNISPEKFTYKLRQEPGIFNSLGQIKFIFPNSYQVYLHDTPYKYLFNYPDRAKSHGCIRVEKPFSLASCLLGKDWDEEEVAEIIRLNKRKVINLKEKIPIYLVYLTSWVDENGIIQHRDDVYNLDQELYEKLKI